MGIFAHLPQGDLLLGRLVGGSAGLQRLERPSSAAGAAVAQLQVDHIVAGLWLSCCG